MNKTRRDGRRSIRATRTGGIVFVLLAAGCQGTPTMKITQEAWGEHDGRPVSLFTLDNGRGMVTQITDYGGIVTSLTVADEVIGGDGIVDLVLGFDTLAEYVAGNPYFGAMVGRVGNRIADARFELDGTVHKLAANNGPHHLHGGVKGFDKVVWDAQPLETTRGPGLRLRYHSPDGEEGYPGAVDATVDYVLTFDDELAIEMTATTDAPTPVNIVHHSYWNLAGHGSGTILDQVLQVDAKRYTPGDATLIPTGAIENVAGTPFDFRLEKAMGADIGELPPTGDEPGGYDLNFVVDGRYDRLRRAALVTDPRSGRTMEIWASMPGIQFYTGNFLDDVAGKGGAVYEKHAGFCLETQYFPDSINKRGTPGWADPVLRPGETYHHVMVHRFRQGGR